MTLLKGLRLLAAALLLLGLVLHLTVRDASGPLRAVFYALPLPVMAAAWFAAALLWWRRRFARISFTLLALGCGAVWLGQSYRTSQPQTPASTSTARPLKVLSWNMAHEKLPSTDLRVFLETFKPDIAGLVEVGSRHSDPEALLTALPPGYTAQKLDYAMAIVVRGSFRLLHQAEMGHVSKFASLEATVDGVIWHVYIVDGASHPTYCCPGAGHGEPFSAPPRRSHTAAICHSCQKSHPRRCRSSPP
jgi:endonuclease/exonuclease/phosphatase (EEP) superfamily protein YafD